MFFANGYSTLGDLPRSLWSGAGLQPQRLATHEAYKAHGEEGNEDFFTLFFVIFPCFLGTSGEFFGFF